MSKPSTSTNRTPAPSDVAPLSQRTTADVLNVVTNPELLNTLSAKQKTAAIEAILAGDLNEEQLKKMRDRGVTGLQLIKKSHLLEPGTLCMDIRTKNAVGVTVVLPRGKGAFCAPGHITTLAECPRVSSKTAKFVFIKYEDLSPIAASDDVS